MALPFMEGPKFKEAARRHIMPFLGRFKSVLLEYIENSGYEPG
jgi:hypothetical protein